MTQEAWGLTLVETRRRAKSPFVLCQERAIPEDRFLGPSLKLSKGLISLPDPKGCCRVCLPLLCPSSPGHFGFGDSAVVVFCTWLDQEEPVAEV